MKITDIIVESAVRHDGNIPKLYHVTAKSNIDSILKSGITPRSNKWVGELGGTFEYTDSVFLTDDYKDIIRYMSTQMLTWGDDKVALLVNTSGMTLYYDPSGSGRYSSEGVNDFFTQDTISPQKILSIIDPKSGKSVTPSELMNNREILNKDTERSNVMYVQGYFGMPEYVFQLYLDSDHGEETPWKAKFFAVDDEYDDDDLESYISAFQSDLDNFEIPVKYVSNRSELVDEFSQWFSGTFGDQVNFDEISTVDASKFRTKYNN